MLITMTRAVVHRSRSAAVAEALGYAGGVLVVVGVALVVANTWDDLGTGGRLATAVVVAVVAAVAAWRVAPGDVTWNAGTRLRSTLWLVSAVCCAFAAGLVVHDVVEATSAHSVFLGAAATLTLVAAGVWRGRMRPVEQTLTWLALAGTAGSVGAYLSTPGFAGVFAAVVGVIALTAGLGELTDPSPVAVWCGAATLLVSCQMIAAQWPTPGLLVCVAVATSLLLLAQLDGLVNQPPHIAACAVMGGVLLFGTLPGAIGFYAQRGAVVTGVVVWALSLLLLAGAERRGLFRAPIPATVLAATLFVVGPAVVTGQQRTAGVVLGLAASTALVVAAVLQAQVRVVLVGSAGLLVYVPWSVAVLVPGALGAPLAIVVAGLVVVLVAVWLLRRRSVTPTDSATSTPSSHAPVDAE